MNTIASELAYFAEKTGVSAAGGGVIDNQGAVHLEVTGYCGRDDETPVALDDVWHLGSCTKAITALLFGVLVSERKASWHMTLAEVFSDLVSSMHAEWHNVPLDELFYCRSGLPANPPMRQMNRLWQDTRPMVEQRTRLTMAAFSQPPKRRGAFRYSNLGYIVLGAALDRLTENGYEQSLQQRVFQPLNIQSAGYGAPSRIKGHSSRLRSPWFNAFKGPASDPLDVKSDNPPVFSSAGTLHMSLPDWAKLLGVLRHGSGHTKIPTEAVDALFDAPDDYLMTRGLGRVQLPDASFATQGSNTQWVATAVFNPQRNAVAMVTCNDGRSRLLRDSVFLALKLLALEDDG